MRIGIDARFLTHPQRGGFKTYSENLIAALAEVDSQNEYVLYLDRPPDETTKLPHRPNVLARIVPGQLALVGMSWREQVSLCRQAARDQLDLLHSPCLTAPLLVACPLAVTIHDLIWLFSDRFSDDKRAPLQRRLMKWYYRLVPVYAARRAAVVFTVSESSRADLVKHLGLAENKIVVTPEAAGAVFRGVDDSRPLASVRERYGLPPEYILALGSADGRKNVPALLEAYSLLPAELQRRFPLVIVWTHPHLAAATQALARRLHIRGLVLGREVAADEDLALFYNAASLFVFPSLYEGFGLPLLEAMACGAPVVAADNSSIPEVAGDAALLVPAGDARAIADALNRVLTDQALRAALVRKGFLRASGFSWRRCAVQTLAGYRQATMARQPQEERASA